jgi:two-component system LytT family response regulator
MKAVILEDENIAAQSLKRQLVEIDPTIEVLQVLQSVEEAVDWFQANDEPDIAFMDIHLADGSVFHLFDTVTVHCPIIFTTAYNQYALEAFKVNSIDYLLKPIDKEDLKHALDKYSDLREKIKQDVEGETRSDAEGSAAIPKEVLQNVISMLQHGERQYKSYFLIPSGDKLVPLATQDIACIYIDNKISVAVTYDGKSHSIDKPLDYLMQDLDPQIFFRANRQYIVSHKAVKDIAFWFGSKLQLRLTVSTPDRIIISKAKVSEFKEWYTIK